LFSQQVSDYNTFVGDRAKFNKDLRGSNMREKILRTEAVLKLHAIKQLSGDAQLKAITHHARQLYEK